MAKRKHKSKEEKLLEKVIKSLLPLIVAVLAGLGIWEYQGGRTVPTAAMPDGALVSVQVIDVGQGSSLLLRTNEQNILIDAGERDAAPQVKAQLDAWGIKTLDLVVLTHPHTDHYGGLLTLLDQYKVKEFWMPAVQEKLLPTNRSYEQLLDALEKNGCEVDLPTEPRIKTLDQGVTLSLLDGFAASPEDLNDTSLCLRIDAGEASFLVTGDGETAVEDQLREGGEPIDVDVLVAGHHGSSTSSRQKFVNAVSPKASAISCGAGNSYGHPNESTLERLAPFGPIYRTDLNNTITFTTDGNTITVKADKINDTIDAKG